MSPTTGARARTRRHIAVGLIVVAAGIVGTLVQRSSSAPSFNAPPLGDHGGTTEAESAVSETGGVAMAADGAVTEADGVVPDGVTAFDDEYPGVANLDPQLLQAVREAAAAAADDGVPFYVNSGWRSPEYQDQLLREAVSEHGSEEAAARWVATADTSAHVSGNAIDIGDLDATAWLSAHGAEYGLCQIYGNEPWHYELRPEAVDRGCPAMYTDTTQDPRMDSDRRAGPVPTR